MIKFVVQSRDMNGQWLDYQAAVDYKEAKTIEADLIERKTPSYQYAHIRETRIVAADQAEDLYHM